MSGDGLHDLLADEAGARIFLDEHGFDAPADAAARRALRETREALRALLLDRDRDRSHGVNAVLARGAQRPLLPPSGVEIEVDAAAAGACRGSARRRWSTCSRRAATASAAAPTPTASLWFLDTSRPGTRRWCSMAACGNRDKAIRHGRPRHQ